MHIAVTGGAGFIGGAFLDEIRDDPQVEEVRALDLTWEEDPEGVVTIAGSILDRDDLSRLMRGCDVVIHLAAMLGVRRTEERRLRCLNVNIEGTRQVLEACVKENVGRIVFSSSSEVYGNVAHRDESSISEDSALNPRSVYAVSKLAGEEYIQSYADHYGLDYTICRLFNVYGPGQVAEFVIPRFVRRVHRGKPPVVYGDGQQVRSFCHVRDAVRGIRLALDRPGEARRRIFNIGNDREPVTIAELARRVVRLSGSDLEPETVPMEESDRAAEREIFYRLPDINRAREALGYAPEVPLDEGLRGLLEGARTAA